MEQTLKTIRDLTIIVAIYLYFIAWVYVHFYYQQFGISTASVNIDYNSYLMYSYNVLTAEKFLFWVKIFAGLVIARMVLLFIIGQLAKKAQLFKKLNAFLSSDLLIGSIKKINTRYSLLLLIIFFIIIFPLLFKVARQVAIDDYHQDRRHTKNLKTIQFVFRNDAGLMAPAVPLDSTLSPNDVFYSDLSLIKKDPQELLRLLGESDQYYIVLHQRPFNNVVGSLPSGYVYFIDKKDVLVSKIILRSL